MFDSMRAKYTFFGLIYFLQGATLAYIINFQKAYLFNKGIEPDTLGLYTSSLLIPFILKIFLGMLSDRVPLGRFGSRKPYMLIGLGLFAFAYYFAGGVDVLQNFKGYWILTWLASLGLALYDTCADGWAIDVASESEQSAVQASMIAGKSVGLISMSIAFGQLMHQYGVSIVLSSLAGMSLVVAAIVLVAPTPPAPVMTPEHRSIWRDFSTFFFLVFAIYGIVYSISSFGADGLMSLYLSAEKMIDNVGLGYFGMARGIGSLLGAGYFVIASRRMSERTVLILALVQLGLGCLLPLADLKPEIMGGIWGVAWGFQETAFVTLAMRISSGPWAATLFAVCMIFSNVGTSLGEIVGGELVQHIGFMRTFTIEAMIAWASLIFVFQFGRAANGSAGRGRAVSYAP